MTPTEYDGILNVYDVKGNKFKNIYRALHLDLSPELNKMTTKIFER